MSDGQSPAPKRSKAEGGLLASLSAGGSSSQPGREGSQKAKGKQRKAKKVKGDAHSRRSFWSRMEDTTSESGDNESLDSCAVGDHQTLKNENQYEVSSDVLGLSGSPGPRPTCGSAPARAPLNPPMNRFERWITGVGSDDSESAGEGEDAPPVPAPVPKDFGDDFANILQHDPPLPMNPTPLAIELLEVSKNNPGSIREWLRTSAMEKAGRCDCATPLRKWDKAAPEDAATCGRQQAGVISAVDMQTVLERQKQRGGKDSVPYILARTVRSCMQYDASIELGCRGAGNQCKRGPCFKSAMDMFAGEGMDGIPKEVVLALLQYQG